MTSSRLPCALALACVLGVSCGKKGPPLAPIVRVPQPVNEISARRVGDEVYITLVVPSQNVDASSPADVSRIDLFAVTADTSVPRDSFLRTASRIAVVQVAPPVAEDEGAAEPPPAPPPGTVAQGSTIVLRETLTADQLTPQVTASPQAPAPSTTDTAQAKPPADAPERDASAGTADAQRGEARKGDAPEADATKGDPAKTGAPAVPRRFYMAYAYSDRQRSSAAGTVASVPLAPLPPAPDGLALNYTPQALTLSWSASTGASGYNVYPVQPGAGSAPASVPPASARGATAAVLPEPINAEPLSATTFEEPVRFGMERCFQVSAIATASATRAGTPLESGLSPAACVTPVDRFAPSTPRDLVAVALDEGGIELRWTPNTEPDLAGYLILRGTAGDATLAQIIEAPLEEARFIDRTVTPGARYSYAVVAVDMATPPNRSSESERDEATAR